MRESPRHRRLRSDLRALQQLKADSTIFDFTVCGPVLGVVPESYLVSFSGPGLWRPDGSEQVLIRHDHQVAIQLGAGYPRMMPELSWRTPVFHPNISANGVVCLGGYSMHWVPSLQLDELCGLLWDMVRYQNYDVDSAYNRAAAKWARDQDGFRFPLDARPLRDRQVVVEAVVPQARSSLPGDLLSAAPSAPPSAGTRVPRPSRPLPELEVLYLDDEIIDAEVVEAGATTGVRQTAAGDILFLQ